jgi:hypothetical protein
VACAYGRTHAICGKSGRCDVVTAKLVRRIWDYLANVRTVIPWVGAAIVLVALWPAVCMSQEGGPTTCQSAVFLPLPWGESADTWGWFAAIAGASITFVVLRLLLRNRAASRN